MPTNRERLPRTPLALAVLNLLAERPMHPYEMKIMMAERGHSRVIRLKGASVYDTVERLERLGFIRSLETSREGRRPERTVYDITEAGRDELRAWMRDLLSMPVPEYPQFAAALAFMVGLQDRDEIVSLLTTRTVALEAEIAAGDVLLRTSVEDAEVPRIFVVEEEYGQTMRRAELEWVRHLIQELKHGDLWPDIEALKAAAAEAQAIDSKGGEEPT